MKQFWLVTIFVSSISLVCTSTSSTSLRNETDRLALIAFKRGITQDPLGVLNSWNDSIKFCKWEGVSCSLRHHQRVIALELPSKSLIGVLSPHIRNLTFLRSIRLQNNSFHGNIPEEIGYLYRLRILQLHNNSLEGNLPINLTHCSDLRHLDLAANNLNGNIPPQLGFQSKLETLRLLLNSFIGRIPSSLGNLSSLSHISLAGNNLEGRIPEELGRIKTLRYLEFSENKLIGTVPSSLYNLSALYCFGVGWNRLEGTLPSNIGLTLPELEYLNLSGNKFTGDIPLTLTNASKLEYILFAFNKFTGPVPGDMGRLQRLYILNMASNQLGSGEGYDLNFISSLANCTGLKMMTFFNNSLKGSLPDSMANLSITITHLSLGNNQIQGSIPSGIENLVGLNVLYLQENYFTGSIPNGIGKLHRLHELFLDRNIFSGQIPASLGDLTQLLYLFLSENSLAGPIPPSLAKCQRLLALLLSNNNLSGPIPGEVMGLPSISVSLQLAGNAFTGLLPPEVGKLQNLRELDVSDNRLSGSIPSALASCVSMERLQMAGNSFDGDIPQAFRTLSSIGYLDLSRNNFSGEIPTYLAELALLNNLNLSFNELNGDVPKLGVFKNASAIAVTGNSNLCGGIPELNLPPCPAKASEKKGNSLVLKITAPVVAVTLCLILLVCFFIIRRWRRTKTGQNLFSLSMSDKQFLRVSYADLLKATNGFSESNLIGTGSFGSVYKGTLDQDDKVIAVKVLNLHRKGASRSFMSECKALKDIRHRNLVKILSACSSIDFQGNEFKALVFEFMPRGNLDKWLHPEVGEDDEQNSFNLSQRLNIAIDVASALEYLHCRCADTVVVHRDLKPSNVLLDSEMTAHVADFGLAKLISSAYSSGVQSHTSSAAIKGTIGYVPPEYGVSAEVSTEGDVYSYGILLLEMFIGRRPTDEMFKDELSLHTFVKMALPERVMDILDPVLLRPEEAKSGKMEECLVSVMRIGISCSMEFPRDRMSMGDVVAKLQAIRDIYQS